MFPRSSWHPHLPNRPAPRARYRRLQEGKEAIGPRRRSLRPSGATGAHGGHKADERRPQAPRGQLPCGAFALPGPHHHAAKGRFTVMRNIRLSGILSVILRFWGPLAVASRNQEAYLSPLDGRTTTAGD